MKYSLTQLWIKLFTNLQLSTSCFSFLEPSSLLNLVVCVCVCIYIYIHTHTHTHTHTQLSSAMKKALSLSLSLSIYIYIYIYIYCNVVKGAVSFITLIYKSSTRNCYNMKYNKHIYMYISIHKFFHFYDNVIYIYIYIYIYIFTHTHTHTHTHTILNSACKCL